MTPPVAPPRGTPAPAPEPPRQGARLGRTVVVVAFGVGLAIAVLLAAVVVAALTEPPPDPRCPDPTAPCGGPPRPPGGERVVPTPEPASGAAPLRLGEPWQSSELGFSFEYGSDTWAIAQQDGRAVQLVPAGQPPGFFYALYVQGIPSAEATAEQLLQALLEVERSGVPDLVVDPSPYNAIQGPSIGYADAVGFSYAGTLPDGTPIGIAILAATHEGLTVGIDLAVTNPNVRPDADDWPTFQYLVRAWTDSILKSFRWEGPP